MIRSKGGVCVCVYFFPAFTPSWHVFLEEEQEMVVSWSGELQKNISVGFIAIEILWMVLIQTLVLQ